MDVDTVYENVRTISAGFAADRRERQQRRELDAADFDRLRDAGFLLTGVPLDHGGIWESVSRSARPICEMLRTLPPWRFLGGLGLCHALARIEFLDGHCRGVSAL